MGQPHLPARIAVFGAGAIGVYLAGWLARGGAQVTLVARPHTAAQLAGRTIRIEEDGEDLHVPDISIIAADEVPRALAAGPFDALLLAVKSQQLASAVAGFAPLVGPGTLVACLQNGIPWWYFHGQPGAWAERHLDSLDPDGALPAALPLERVLGAVIHKAAELVAPGHVVARRAAGDRFIFGTPSGAVPEGLEALLAAFAAAGIAAGTSDDIRRDVWEKLLGNAVLNPLSALTGAQTGQVVEFPPSRRLALDTMGEVSAVARAHGVTLSQTPEERAERSRAIGAARTSMLQDASRGRPLEVDGILGGLLELARLARVPAPRLETLYAAASLLSHTLTSKP